MKPTIERDPYLTPHVLRACRACDRLMNDSMADISMCHEADRSYDGGEWSDPAYDKIYENLETGIIRMVAERFDIPDEQLSTLWMYTYPYDQDSCWQYAVGHRPFSMPYHGDKIGDLT